MKTTNDKLSYSQSHASFGNTNIKTKAQDRGIVGVAVVFGNIDDWRELYSK